VSGKGVEKKKKTCSCARNGRRRSFAVRKEILSAEIELGNHRSNPNKITNEIDYLLK
jgi:hypothetical protein